MEYDIAGAIPHRAPFLFLDEITEIAADSLKAEYTLRPGDELWSRVYSGHYPGSPITPGVLLCEMMLQAGAVLVREMTGAASATGMPVVTRLQNVKFKAMVPPGSRVEIRVAMTERLAGAFFMKGGVWQGGKPAVQAEFAVAMTESRTES